MSLLSQTKKVTYATLIDVGSGSVLVSIIASKVGVVLPTIIWSHREISPLKQTEVDIPAKHLMGSLLNAVLQVQGQGIEALKSFDSEARLTHIQISYSAPWSYTVQKTMNFSQPEPFIITAELLHDLKAAIAKKIEEERVDKEVTKHRGLTIINQSLSALTVNGYLCHSPLGQIATTISLSHTSDITETIMVDALTELQRKILPRATVTQHSFIHLFHQTLLATESIQHDYCLINVSYEATEIGVVHNNTLERVSTIPVGINTLVRGYSAAMDVPHEEAYSFLREPYHSQALETLSATKKRAVDDVTAEYKRHLITLFSEKTDLLSIPKTLIVYNTQEIDSFLNVAIAEATKEVTFATHTIRNVADYIRLPEVSDIQKQFPHQPYISAQFFHQQSNPT